MLSLIHQRLIGRGRRLAALLCAVSAIALAAPFAVAEEAASLNGFLQNHYVETLALLPSLTLLALLGFIITTDPYIRPNLRRTMRIIVVLVLSLVAQNYIEYRLAAGETRRLARTLAAIYGYAVRPAILALFLKVVVPRRQFGWAWILVGVNAAVNATALFSHICFWIDANNHYNGGPLSRMCLWVSAILLVCWFIVTLRAFRPRRRETWVPALVLALIVGAIVMDYNVGYIPQPTSFLTIAVAVGCVAYYIWLHLQFVRQHERALVAGQRVQLMLSQIKPHFLYNALGAIEGLCVTDPRGARTATSKFAQYLRGNLDAITQQPMTPFEKELAHTRLYLELEQLRFGEDLRVRYDIACTDFDIPTLTLEPLAENAVRHGVRENPSGQGTVIISTRETPAGYEIAVTDDGVGFDPDRLSEGDEAHVGIRNVRERLLRVCGGTLKIESGVGRGTTATIILPRDGEVTAC